MSRMGEDLKEIICHLNTSVKSQDSKDPVHQIGKVLNAHMDSLQWIDSHAQSVERKLQVSSVKSVNMRLYRVLSCRRLADWLSFTAVMARDYRDLTLTELDFILSKLFHYYVLRNFNTTIDINLNLFFVSRVVLADFNNVVDFPIDTSFLLSDH